jgi:hypothetical protein
MRKEELTDLTSGWERTTTEEKGRELVTQVNKELQHS